jgi:7-cyano-7-deazaguanine synthase
MPRYDYGQPHRNADIPMAQRIVERLGLHLETLLLPELKSLNPAAGLDDRGLSQAFVPGRNLLFLARAASFLAVPGEDLTLVCGANADDARGFPDCRREFFRSAQETLHLSLEGLVPHLYIATPWLDYTKAQIVEWCARRPNALRDIRESVSCYRGTRCGQCDPCVLRAAAFTSRGLTDGDGVLVPMCGGDPGRDAAFAR